MVDLISHFSDILLQICLQLDHSGFESALLITAFYNRMTARPLLKFLYPRTHRDLSFATKDAYILFYSTGRNLTGLSRSPSCASGWSTCAYSTKAGASAEESKGTSIGKKSDDFQQRLKELQNANALKYPRIQPDRNAISCAEFKKRYAVLNPEESRESDNVTLRGMLNHVVSVSTMTD